MKKMICCLFTSMIFASCNQYNNYMFVQDMTFSNCLYTFNGEERYILDNLSIYEISVTNCFFVNENIICVATEYKVRLYDIKRGDFYKVISFREGNYEKQHPEKGVSILINSYGTIATVKDRDNILIISFGEIYNYNLLTDELTLLYSGFDKLIPFPEYSSFSVSTEILGRAAPAYSKLRNSFFFTYKQRGATIRHIKEFSLTDFTLSEVVLGSRPYVINDKLLYINEDESKIIEKDLNTMEDTRVILKYKHPIYYFVTNKKGDKLVFIHRSYFKTIRDNYYHDSKIWTEKDKKIRRFSDEYWSISSDIIFPEDMTQKHID